jgi:oligopeptide transport system substrate-binding protein
MNPYSETLADASTMYGFLTDSLYMGDYDWATAIADGLATEIGDFATSGAASLPYARVASMAAGEPGDVNDDGLVWQISLREDLEFTDGTAIDANTFEYSWQQLLDPDLLNDRASNLYQDTDLPLVNAEDYFKQNSFKTDKLGFNLYSLDGGITAARENSFSHLVTGTTWELYYVETSEYSGITYAAGATALEQTIYTEYWGDGYGPEGWVFVDFEDNAFKTDSEGTLIAPYAGWTYADGTAVATEAVGDASYYGEYPAYYSDADTPARLDVDAEGVPVGGTPITQDPVAWSTVGFKVIDTYTIEITLASAKTAWDVKGALMSGIVGVVHPAKFEEGMNETGTQTTYGTIDNPLVSYGPYVLDEWNDGQNFKFERNEDYFNADLYDIKYIRYEIIEDQSIAVDEFKAGRLDLAGISGDYFDEFKFSPNLKLTPSTTFFRFAFNVEGSDQYELNPILVDADFRLAFYYAIDREEFALNVRAPSHPTHGFLGPVYLSTEYNSVSYRESAAGLSVLSELSPETNGYNPEKAKELFDKAYAAAVTAEKIEDGDTVYVEYKFYDVETNWKVANWVKSTVEGIFNNADQNKPMFVLTLTAVSSAALNQAWDNGDFEMTFGGWTGLDKDAPSMLGQVYNSDKAYILEKGFNTADAEVTVALPKTKVALTAWVAEIVALGDDATDTQLANKEAWEAMLLEFDGDNLVTTYDSLFNYAYGELYNVKDVNYDGKTEEFNNITGALETVLLEQMIAIPLFTSVSATVYSERVVFEADSYHAWMGWGGYTYMYIAKSE